MGRTNGTLRAACYHCGSTDTTKAGFHSNGKRRFKCKACSRDFIDPATRTLRTGPLPPAGTLTLKLRAIAEKLGRTPATSDIRRLAKEGRSYKLDDYRTVFGNFSKALKRAGLKSNYSRTFDEHEKELMLAELRRLSRKMGRALSTDDVRAARREKAVSPVTQYEKAFGSIRNALNAAGVGVKVFYTDEEMIAILRKISMQLDRPVRLEDLGDYHQKNGGPAPRTIFRRFGGNMEKVRAAAGINQHYRFAGGRTKNWQKYTRDELLEQLRALAARLGRKPTYKEINAAPRDECATSVTFSRMFGSMVEAYRAAGFDARPHKQTDKEIIAALRRLRRKLGHFPTQREIRQAKQAGECPSDETIRVRLGPLGEIKEWI